MTKTYSAYEAKAKLSELLQRVRGGQRVIISYRGEEVAEVRPIEKSETAEERVRELKARGVLRPPARRRPLEPLARRPGALERFLESRD